MQANDLGISVLLRVFQQTDDVRAEVLDQLFSRIISKTDSAPACASRYVVAARLPFLSRQAPDSSRGGRSGRAVGTHGEGSRLARVPLTNVATKRQGCALPYRAPLTRIADVLQAVQPLFGRHPDFLDSTVLVLRKSMFNKEVEARLVGLLGSVQLLKSFKNAAQQPQMERLRMELLGFLRKCLSQQSQVREELYRALPDVLRTNPTLHVAVFGLLAPQLARYFEAAANNDRAYRPDISMPHT